MVAAIGTVRFELERQPRNVGWRGRTFQQRRFMLKIHAMNSIAALDLNLLVVFDAILKERNISLAGQRIGLSQPAMRSALGRLR